MGNERGVILYWLETGRLLKQWTNLTLDIRIGSLEPAFGIWFGGISQSSVFKTQPICWQAKAADSTVQPKLQTVPHWLSILTWKIVLLDKGFDF